MPFVSTFLPPSEQSATDLWFVFHGDRLLVKDTTVSHRIPRQSDLTHIKQALSGTHYLGTLDGFPCYAGEAEEHVIDPEGMVFRELRPLLGILGEDLFSVAARAFQILHWDRTHQFCGRCGGQTDPKVEERAKVCGKCGFISYPTISPAIIVAVTKGPEILLARSPRFQYDFYSVLAGFVEYGETFEQCVRREVKEEVGIDVDNIRYFGSQPWPFPNTLMVGFTADYAGGALTVDKAEITDARWFTARDLPPLPRAGSIARRLIDWFVDKSGK